MTVNPDAIHSIEIFPPIGISRVGNSPDHFFIGPEVPGHFENPEGGFKHQGKVKRQAARFRVYAFDDKRNLLGELNASNEYQLEWDVEVANKKPAWYAFMGRTQPGAFQEGSTTLRNPTIQKDLHPDKRSRLIITPGPKKIRGEPGAKPVPLHGTFHGTNPEPTDVYLGELRTDNSGRLLFLPGNGLSRSVLDPKNPYPLIMTDFDSSDWIDDTCDGTVRVRVKHSRSNKMFEPKLTSRVIGTTPKFSTAIFAPTTLYDVMENIYSRKRRENKETPNDDEGIVFYRDIWPLLQRPSLLSWVNGQADGGHGPNGHGNFFKPSWRAALSDPKHPEGEDSRKLVLGRMRLPEGEKYAVARTGQAYSYFMPWLSGDGGRTTAGDITTFASVTELQYERLDKWAAGDFTTGTPPEDESKADLPITPAGLTKANLEWTIGAPLYPGIEMSWNAEEIATYNLEVPFRIAESVKPGDLTKYLSLPWQSDFYMCRNYWWPSARPDDIVSEKEYELQKKVTASDPASLARTLTNRVPWERGIHQNYTDQFDNQPLFANTDMAQNWHKLGFVVQKPSQGPEPIFVEVERQDPRSPASSVAKPERVDGPRLTLPRPDTTEPGKCPIQSVESLRTHLQTAMAVELSTIPLYLFAMYSIKPPASSVNDPLYFDTVVDAFRGIVAEEMLHLSLAGNVLKAIGGTPKLYSRDLVPDYPMQMPGRVPKLEMQLRAATKMNLQTFIDVELPMQKGAPAQADSYNTLGQFYEAIERGLKELDAKYRMQGKKLFDESTKPFQFLPGLGYVPRVRDAGGSVFVQDLASALRALNIIVEQGEGADGEFDDPADEEKAHYYIFSQLKTDKSMKWHTYNVRENPHTVDYKDHDDRIYHVSRAFDAAYCYLLLTIEQLWTVPEDTDRKKLVLGNMYGLMMGVLAPLAKFLVMQPISGGGAGEEAAAPCFDFYDFDVEGKTPFELVQQEFADALQSYVGVTAETSDQVPVEAFGAQINVLLPIVGTAQGLLDLSTFKKGTVSVRKAEVNGVHSRGAKGFGKGF